MKTKLLVFVVLALAACGRPIAEKPEWKQLDSLLQFDSITAIYGHGDYPPFVVPDELLDGEMHASRQLHTDSVGRWTDSKAIIDSIRKLFPSFTKHGGIIGGTRCGDCGERDLLFKTTNGKFSFSWNLFSDDSTVVVFDTVRYFNTDKKILERIYNLLDRKIITKEVFRKDTIYYSRKDIYNSEFGRRGNVDTWLVYILK